MALDLPGVVPSCGSGMAMTSPQLPAFYMPIADTGVSPWLPAAERALWPWLDERRLAPGEHVRAHIKRTNPALLGARFYPAAGAGTLPLLAQFCAWAFIVDDEFDEGPCGRDPVLSARAVAELLAALERGTLERGALQHGAAATASPPAAALTDLWGRLAAGRSASWRRQFADNIRSWLVTYHRVVLEREAGYAPGIEEFRGYRQLAVGMHMFMDLAEAVAGVDLPDEIRYSPAVMDLRRAVAEHVAFLNDIFSAHKEEQHGFPHNLVLVVDRVLGCGVQAAVGRANAMATGAVLGFLDARRRLPGELAALGADAAAAGAAARYAHSLAAVMRGNYDWHFGSKRYTHSDELGTALPGYVANLFQAAPEELLE
jgi:(+)-beta-caryophyllene/(+)-caryolan-1-ol synthase